MRHFDFCLSILFCCGNFHGFETQEQNCSPNCNVSVICPLFLHRGPHDDLVRFSHTQSCGFIGFQNTRKFSFDTSGFISSHPMLTVLACLARHRGSHWCFQILASILDGFFEFLVLEVDEVDSSQFSCIIEFWLFM